MGKVNSYVYTVMKDIWRHFKMHCMQHNCYAHVWLFQCLWHYWQYKALIKMSSCHQNQNVLNLFCKCHNVTCTNLLVYCLNLMLSDTVNVELKHLVAPNWSIICMIRKKCEKNMAFILHNKGQTEPPGSLTTHTHNKTLTNMY